jgi:hypothetical protein
VKKWYILVVAVFIAACESTPTNGFEYTFVNLTSYSIYVTLDKKYRLTADSSATEYDATQSFSLYPDREQTAYVDSKSVSFQWTTSGGKDNIYVYTVKDESKVTFKEREK